MSQSGTEVCGGGSARAGASLFMKHAASRELYTYWEEKRGTRPAPERAEIEPGAIRGVLSDAFILALDPSASPHRNATYNPQITGIHHQCRFGRSPKPTVSSSSRAI